VPSTLIAALPEPEVIDLTKDEDKVQPDENDEGEIYERMPDGSWQKL
jgi:hypothetical protein